MDTDDRPSILATVDRSVAHVRLGERMSTVVFRRRHGGREYVRWRVWHMHRDRRVWYPDKRRGGVLRLEVAGAVAQGIPAAGPGRAGWRNAALARRADARQGGAREEAVRTQRPGGARRRRQAEGPQVAGVGARHPSQPTGAHRAVRNRASTGPHLRCRGPGRSGVLFHRGIPDRPRPRVVRMRLTEARDCATMVRPARRCRGKGLVVIDAAAGKHPAKETDPPGGGAQSGARGDDLARVIDAWPSLPDAVRTGIVAMVRAAVHGLPAADTGQREVKNGGK